MAFIRCLFACWIFSISVILFCSISVSSFELVVSSNKEVFFFENSPNKSEPRRLKFPKQILALGSDFNEDVFVVTQSELAIFSASVKNHTIPLPPQHAFSSVLPDYQNGRILVTNLTGISAIKSPDFQEELYQGTSLTSLSLDVCTSSLMFIDGQRIYKNFSEAIPDTKGAQLLASHSGYTVFIAKNLELSHSDGFVLKSLNGVFICQSDPEKSYNIRSIQLGSKTDLFLADAHNMVIWHLDLLGPKSMTCDLKVWIRLSSQPNQIAILDSPQDCTYAKDQGVSYQINPGDSEVRQNTSKSGTYTSDDACHNFCLNEGVCKLNSLGIPYCTCKSGAFQGLRCEQQACLNYCLNDGQCHVNLESGLPQCLCQESFFGLRCQNGTSIEVEVVTDFYSTAFYVAIGFNLVLLMALIGLFGLHFRQRGQTQQQQLQSLDNEPDVVRKTARTRTFSSNKTRSRSRKEAHTTNSAVNEAFSDFKDNSASEEKCIDDNGLLCQALITDDGVVLDLEDCCQMTLCEKPCIQASFRKPTNRKKAHHIDEQQLIY